MNRRFTASIVLSTVLLALLWGGTGRAASMPRAALAELPKASAVVLGPNGPLVTYKNCSAEQQTALGNALTGIGTTLAGDCVAGAALKTCLTNKSASVTIICGGKSCTEEPRLAGETVRGSNWVRICPRSFNNAQRLEAVLFHELVHTCDRDEKTAEACQNACYEGKGATPPDEGEGGGTCNGQQSHTLAIFPIAPAAPQQIAAALTVASPFAFWGDPITLTFQLVNTDPTNVITVNTSWYDPNQNSLAITGPGGQPVPSNILWEVDPPGASSYIALPPNGGAFSDQFVITPESYSLQPGPQNIQVIYSNFETGIYFQVYPFPLIGNAHAWTGTVASNFVLVHVQPRMIYLPLVLRN